MQNKKITKDDIKNFKEKVLDNHLKKVRNRNSYKRFEDILRWLCERRRTPEEVLLKIHSIIDNMGGYKYRQTSMYAEESLTVLLADLIKDEKEI